MSFDITQDQYELSEVYEKRVAVTNSIFEKYNLNPMTAMVMGRMLINKMMYNVKYDDEVETLLSKLNL